MAHSPSRSGSGPFAPGSARARREVRRAWLSLGLLLPALVLAVLLGDWLLSLQGYDDSDERVPLTAELIAGGPALLVLITPGPAALFYGLRALRHGDPAGLTPAVVGGIAACALALLNVVALAVGR